ncbi:hypothetical protein NQ318_023552 [Aromia moschata]|uniref:Uncharacterized protein n=1 Tax=Aromia moschata TaxID=1265417 RepID=A0AAV8YQ13_9CUCU|nr:hypothetical protein NQ318_023552 [Aromia moschata]
MLVQALLALIIIFNRKRIGNVQYLKISEYKNDQKSNYTDFENALSSTEKILATQYRRVLSSEILLEHRDKFIEGDNDYLFAIPIKNPADITSNSLRKQIATVMQILNLSKDDIKQFPTFRGHTEKTHQEFYELPVDLYQIDKVSKMLLMNENGVLIEHKGKPLSEIDIQGMS